MLSFLTRYRDLILPISIIACVAVILVPLPPAVMDLLLAANITISVVILLTTIYVASPFEFNVFPVILVVTALSRLVLNLATTRLILTRSETDGLNAAGGVIQAFGEFVAGDRLEVGLILFVIIFVIQFVVITKGATRISEVAARFALDGMPGKQMAIDADLSAGAIDEKEAQRRRDDVTRQADFYGAMDGASKFVRGDSIAGIVITIINVLGGLYIGYFHAGMTLTEAAEVFTKLSIGDGLVSQVPAFLISIAAAMLVTRNNERVNLPVRFLQQLFSNPRALLVSGAFLGLLIFTQLPSIPLLTLGGGCLGLGLMLQRQMSRANDLAEKTRQAEEVAKNQPAEKTVEDYLEVDPMRLELSASLVPLAKPELGGDLMKRISTVRAMLATEIGMLLPTVRITDRMSLEQNEYVIQIAGNRVASGTVIPDKLLAINAGNTTGVVDGITTFDPAFHQPAVWINASDRQRAEIFGYQVAKPAAVIATHTQEVAKKYGAELLTRDATKNLIDQLKKSSPTVVEELIPGLLKLSEVQQILQNLLRESVPIRQLGLILETLGDYATKVKDPLFLTEYVRHRLARTISHRFRDGTGTIHVITLDPAVEDRIAASVEHTDHGLKIRMSPIVSKMTCELVEKEVRKLSDLGLPQVVLVSPRIRPALRQITEDSMPDLRVLSYHEISKDTSIDSIGIVVDPQPTHGPTG